MGTPALQHETTKKYLSSKPSGQSLCVSLKHYKINELWGCKWTLTESLK